MTLDPDAAIDEIALWLQTTGYPFDWTCETPPPACLHAPIIKAWFVDDPPGSGVTYEQWAETIADEGGWSS